MKRKEKGRLRLWVFVLAMLAAGILAGYFFGMEQGRKDAEKPAAEKALTTKTQAPPEDVPVAKGPVVIPEDKELKSIDAKSYCERVEEEIQDYFKYLNGRNYVRHLTEGGDTYTRYKALIRKLSAKLPVPAGEGIDSLIMSENIFWFFRALDKNDFRLIRDILKNEAENLEPTLELFYRWAALGNRCADPEGIRPSSDLLYHYAGFFLNTIGGRSYLFRRSQGLRLLSSYYSLLILQEADQQGRNSYGIDVLPFIAPLAREISVYPDFRLKRTYLKNLEQMEKEYLKKRQ
ncbi:MAG: hypothetical protein ACM335_11110 [Deltaproteobacteria bacterium]